MLLVGMAGAFALSASTLFFGWIVLNLGASYNVSNFALIMLWAFFALFTATSIFLWTTGIRRIRCAHVPVIAFRGDHVEYQNIERKTVSLPLIDVVGIEFDHLSPNLGGGHLLVRKSNAEIDRVFVFNLAGSDAEVFAAFRERAPHLIQPHRAIKRLVRSL